MTVSDKKYGWQSLKTKSISIDVIYSSSAAHSLQVGVGLFNFYFWGILLTFSVFISECKFRFLFCVGAD